MKRLAAFTILPLFALFITDAYAPEPITFKVYVDVVGPEEDKTEANIIESHLKRELRFLGDVVIVGEEDDWTWRILVNVLGHSFKDGRKQDWVSIASSIQRRVPKSYFKNYTFISPHIPVITDPYPTPAHWSKDDLHAWCIATANSVDEKLKIFREIYR